MVSARALVGLFLGVVIGVAIVQLLRDGEPAAVPTHRRPPPRVLPWLVGVGSGLCLLLLTGWPVLGLAGGFILAQMLKSILEDRKQAKVLRRRAELARFAANLRDACVAGHGMADAVRIAAATAGPTIRADMALLAAEVRRVGVGSAFARQALTAPDPLFRVFATMVGEADRQGGGALSGLLTQLARQTMREVTGARESRASLGGQRATAPVVASTAIVILLAVRFASPAYAGAYSDAAGQVGMALGLTPIGIGYLLMVRAQRSASRALSWGAAS